MTKAKNSTSNRRSFLLKAATVTAGSAALAMAPPAIALPGVPDPIIARIVTHKKLTTNWQGLYDQLQDAEIDAASEHGNRPIELIHWRNYTIGASEIDTRREQLLEAGEVDPATIEQEYLDANARYQAQVAAALA